MTALAFEAVEVGTELPARSYPVSRETLVRYAGASGDFNRIHWDQQFAVSVGLPDVIAHGMLTMAEAIRAVGEWTGNPGAVLEFGVRFTRPVIVADAAGAVLEVTGQVSEVRAEDRTAVVALSVACAGVTVLAKARAVVRLA